MIKIKKEQEKLLLEYSSDEGGLRWVHQKLKDDKEATLRKTFTFTAGDILEKEESPDHDDEYHDDEYHEDIVFTLGIKKDGYYQIEARILGLEHDLYLAEDMDITLKTFIGTGIFLSLVGLMIWFLSRYILVAMKRMQFPLRNLRLCYHDFLIQQKLRTTRDQEFPWF